MRFSVSGLDKIFGKSATVNDRVDINEGNMFVCAYPSGNIAELTQTRLLYENIREENESKKSKESDAPASKTKTKKKSLVVVNGELDRTRSNYYPWFWNKKRNGTVARVFAIVRGDIFHPQLQRH